MRQVSVDLGRVTFVASMRPGQAAPDEGKAGAAAAAYNKLQ